MFTAFIVQALLTSAAFANPDQPMAEIGGERQGLRLEEHRAAAMLVWTYFPLRGKNRFGLQLNKGSFKGFVRLTAIFKAARRDYCVSFFSLQSTSCRRSLFRVGCVNESKMIVTWRQGK
jgi:hypothetical protein